MGNGLAQAFDTAEDRAPPETPQTAPDAAAAGDDVVSELQRLGKYTLLDTLGAGAAGVIYHAHLAGPMGFRKQVALKTITADPARQESSLRALINEARLGGHLQHPNIVSILDFGQVDDTFYIAMEYVQGHALLDVLARSATHGPLPPSVIAGIAVQICRGLAYAHTAIDDRGQPLALIHRDLKPANVMLTARGHAKLLDFGISTAANNLFHDQPGKTAGTPAYMSPEQTTGKQLDHRSDLFSLASLIAEMILGEPVFAVEDARATLKRVHDVDVGDALARIDASMPQFVPLLKRAWQADRDRRFRSAEAMGQAIHRASRGAGHRPAGEPKLARWLARWMSAMPGTSTAERLAGESADPTPPSCSASSASTIDATEPSRAVVAGVTPGTTPPAPLRLPRQLEKAAAWLTSWVRGERETHDRIRFSTEDLQPYSVDDDVSVDDEDWSTFEQTLRIPEDVARALAELPPDDVGEADGDTARARLLPDEDDGAGSAEGAVDAALRQLGAEDTQPDRGDDDEDEASISCGRFRRGRGKVTGRIRPELAVSVEIEREVAAHERIEWIEIRPGQFWRGSDYGEAGHAEDEVRHQVTIGQRFLAAHVPVTQSLWTATMGHNPSEIREPSHPVEGVSWFDAVLFCNVYSEVWGLEPAYQIHGGKVAWNREATGYRLLTEAEWEFAARAGGPGPFAGAADPRTVAWFEANARGRTQPVARLAANAWGLHDTAGNVWEWVWDRYDPHPERGSVVDPAGHWSNSQRVARGGSWKSPQIEVHSARRRTGDVMEADHDLGLRLARSLF